MISIAALVAVAGMAGAAGGYYFGKSKEPVAAEAVSPPAQTSTPVPKAAAGGQAQAVPERFLRAPGKDALYSIELAAFRDVDSARLYATEMVGRKLPVEIIETLDVNGRSWFRIRTGRYDDVFQAEARLPDVYRVARVHGSVAREEAPATPGPKQ